MNNMVQSFNEEIEKERIKEIIEHGVFIFINSSVFSISFGFVLWPYVNKPLLVLWLLVFNSINLVSRIGFHFIKKRLNTLNTKDIFNIKLFLLMAALLTGSCWGVASLMFIDSTQPNTLLIISLSIIFVSTNTILSLFSFFPAVLGFILTAGGFLIVPLLLHEDKSLIEIGLILAVTLVFCIIGCFKVGRSFTSTLLLNQENISLRRDSDDKTLLLETALENIDQGISMSDKNDRLRMWNRPFTHFTGLQEDKLTAGINLESILNATNPPLIVDSANKSQYNLKDGRVIEIRQNRIKQGGRVLTFTDISDLIQREHALEQARKAAEKANAAKTRFLAAASHDLRQPIHALGLFFAELSDRIRNPDTELLIEQVDDSISAITSMLNALLDVSKLDAGVIKPKIARFSLKSLFTRLQLDFGSIASENHNELRIRETSLAVKSDATLLESILRNIIGNALRYTNHGRVLVAARRRGGNIQIQVFDNGPGIPENHLEEIFIEFHQLENPARDRRKGLGLGLAIVKRLADLLDHKITVYSKLGYGCCFTITLPTALVPAAEAGTKTYSPSLSHTIAKRQILVLDDDEAVLKSMSGLLKRWGCHVTTASSSAQAFEKLNNQLIKPELIIVDYRLPESASGIEVAQKIQHCLAHPCSVLIVTGDTGPELLQEAQSCSYPLLHKPLQPAKLRSTIEYLFSTLNNTDSRTY